MNNNVIINPSLIMKHYTVTALLFLSFLSIGSVVLDSSNDSHKATIGHISINNTSNSILIYTINSNELEKELVKIVEAHQHSSYLTEHKEATCTIYQIADNQLQITVSPNGDGLGVDFDESGIINCNKSIVACCLDWLDEEQTNCLTLRNVNGEYRAFKENC